MFTKDAALALLNAAGVFYPFDPADPEEDGEAQTLNQNDTWGWALAWGVKVPDDELAELARLFWHYGNCGVLYWVSARNENMRSEFLDNNRAIDFVMHEEALLKEIPDSSARAYKKITYTLGE